MEDNEGAIAMCKNPNSHVRTKHTGIKFHHVRDAVKDWIILLTYWPAEEMIADMFTKPLTRTRFESLVMLWAWTTSTKTFNDQIN